ncbi:MAG: SUMF1/EgtB/PvdO family nonheme iron enzyme [Planctomycetaceae bacterium]|nr:SUMF1/EgtB/PvdO family nonheme iron enzyme [Planctomycetaceae bacterium]
MKMTINTRRMWHVLLLLAGCAGEDPASRPAPNAQPSAPPPPKMVQQPAPQAAPPLVPQKKIEPATPPVVKNSLPPGAAPGDIFLKLPADRGNFTIITDGDGTREADWFVAVRPAQGSNATSFLMVTPAGATGSSGRTTSTRLPENFSVVAEAGATSDGWPRRIRSQIDGAEMAFVPGGVFVFGREGGGEQVLPAQPVELDPFYMDVTEVTLDRYERYRAAVREERRLAPLPINADASPDLPALGIEWGEAVRYAQWAKKSLPTEAEWELAARGPKSFDRPWGPGRAVWHVQRDVGQIDPVGMFPTDRSPFGLLDMAGNAREWTRDFYGVEQTDASRTRGGTAVRNPTGPKRPALANHRVIKGGGPDWELWNRSSAGMSAPPPDVGFRCILRVARDGNTVSVRTLDGERAEKDADTAAPASERPRSRNVRSPSSGL